MNAKSTKQTGTKTTLQKTQARAASRQAKLKAKADAIRAAGKVSAPAAETPKTDDVAKTVAAVTKGDLTKGVEVPMPAKKTGKAKTAKAPKAGRKMSGLDAAAKVLAESATPLNAKQIIEQAAAKGYWVSPGGKTPAATIYAAMATEIVKKGDQARFKKTDRGLFTVTAAGKQAK